MTHEIVATKRFAHDVGACRCCGYPAGDKAKPPTATVNVIGLWRARGMGLEFVLCQACTVMLRMSLDQCMGTQAQRSDHAFGTSRPNDEKPAKRKPEPTGAIARGVERKAHVPASRKPRQRKPRKYAAKVPGASTRRAATVPPLRASSEGDNA